MANSVKVTEVSIKGQKSSELTSKGANVIMPKGTDLTKIVEDDVTVKFEGKGKVASKAIDSYGAKVTVKITTEAGTEQDVVINVEAYKGEKNTDITSSNEEKFVVTKTNILVKKEGLTVKDLKDTIKTVDKNATFTVESNTNDTNVIANTMSVKVTAEDDTITKTYNIVIDVAE